jgi:AcrR family transcriptional regulator
MYDDNMVRTTEQLRHQGPTGVSRRRTRISDAETEERMIQAALDLVADAGLTVSLDHLSMETVIARADVSRTSAYRRWPFKDLFLADLLVAVARHTDLSAEPPGLVDDLKALIDAADLTRAESRRDLLIEALRRSSATEFERLLSSPRWRTYIALSATVTGLPAGPIRDAASAAILDAERRFAERRGGVYRNLARMIGYRPRGLDPDTGFELMASASGAVMTGYIVRALVNEDLVIASRPLAAFGSRHVAAWTVPTYGLTAVFEAFLEPDPDASWSESAIVERRRLWTTTADSLYLM